MPKRYLAALIKLTTGVYVTPPPFRFKRKHHNYANKNFKNIFIV